MADYAKKTVAELQEVLKSRSLPHTGKKADLVARLQEYDASNENAAEGQYLTSHSSGSCYHSILGHVHV